MTEAATGIIVSLVACCSKYKESPKIENQKINPMNMPRERKRSLIIA